MRTADIVFVCRLTFWTMIIAPIAKTLSTLMAKKTENLQGVKTDFIPTETAMNGTAGLSPRQKQFHQKTKVRDCALLALMLGTGIRVSECVGLNLSDVDIKEQGIHIHRKGGKEATVYFSDEVAQYLERYLEERRTLGSIETETGSQDEPALFLSLRKKRLTVRSVEYLVKKYASVATPKKKITPHKLRSSYGSALYAKTNDIYLVADILGHNDVNITRKFYAAIEEERRKSVKHIDIV